MTAQRKHAYKQAASAHVDLVSHQLFYVPIYRHGDQRVGSTQKKNLETSIPLLANLTSDSEADWFIYDRLFCRRNDDPL
jgi:hypothetical protein